MRENRKYLHLNEEKKPQEVFPGVLNAMFSPGTGLEEVIRGSSPEAE